MPGFVYRCIAFPSGVAPVDGSGQVVQVQDDIGRNDFAQVFPRAGKGARLMASVDSVDGPDFVVRLDQKVPPPEMMGSLVHVRCKPAGFIIAKVRREETLPLEQRMQQEVEAAEAATEAADSDYDEAEQATQGQRKRKRKR
jgi:hypothetical protein